MKQKYRDKIVFSVFYLSFFSGELIVTNEVFGWVKIRQVRIKEQISWVDNNFNQYFGDIKYRWTIDKIY